MIRTDMGVNPQIETTNQLEEMVETLIATTVAAVESIPHKQNHARTLSAGSPRRSSYDKERSTDYAEVAEWLCH
jgi:hypothetical protein